MFLDFKPKKSALNVGAKEKPHQFPDLKKYFDECKLKEENMKKNESIEKKRKAKEEVKKIDPDSSENSVKINHFL